MNRKTIKRLLCVILAFCGYFVVIWLLANVCNAAITAPENIQPGDLARVVCDSEADWSVVPEEYSSMAYVDSNRKTLAISSPRPGTVYIFAATKDESGEPKGYVWKLTISEEAEPNPAPEDDEDVAPEPDTKLFPGNVIEAMDDVPDFTTAERDAFAYVVGSTVEFIEQGAIRTVPGIRETIRRNWTIRAAHVSKTTETRWAPVMVLLFEQLESNDVKACRESLNVVLSAIDAKKKAEKEAAEKAAEEAAKKTEAKPTTTNRGGCPNGMCPLQYGY